MNYTKKFGEFVQEDKVNLELEAEKKPGPDAYMTGLDDEQEEDKEDQIDKQSKMDDDDPKAYKEMPGDEEARKKGKVKKSKHTKTYAELYGEAKELDEGVWSASALRRMNAKPMPGRYFISDENGNILERGLKTSRSWVTYLQRHGKGSYGYLGGQKPKVVNIHDGKKNNEVIEQYYWVDKYGNGNYSIDIDNPTAGKRGEIDHELVNYKEIERQLGVANESMNEGIGMGAIEPFLPVILAYIESGGAGRLVHSIKNNLKAIPKVINNFRNMKDITRILRKLEKHPKINGYLNNLDPEGVEVMFQELSMADMKLMYSHLGLDWNPKEYLEIKRKADRGEWAKESYDLDEGTMSDIHLMADEVKSEDEFIKRFFSEYGNKIKKTKDSEDWARSLYSDMVNEKKYIYLPKYDNAGYQYAEDLIATLRSKFYKKWSDEEFDEFRRAMIRHFDLPIPDFLQESEHQIQQLDSMAYGQLERCVDYATMIRDRYDSGYSFDSWMYGKITKAEEHLNAVFDAMDGDDGVIESTLNEDLKRDLKKFVKKNEKEIDKLADEDDWDQIYNMIYSEFDIDPKSNAGKEVRTLLNLVY